MNNITTTSNNLVITNARVFSSQGDGIADIHIKNGIISSVNYKNSVSFFQVDQQPNQNIHHIDLEGRWILPGIIDSQVHFREPGLEHKEDISSGSLSALLGGVTTFLEMPNTSPPTTTCEALKDKLNIAKKTSYVNYGFFIGATENNLDELIKAEKLSGCCGIKIFLGSSTGNLLVNNFDSIEAIFRNTTMPISIHSEDENRLMERKHIFHKANGVYDHNIWRDRLTATQSTEKIVDLARKCNRKIHILHISTAEEIKFLAKNKDLVSVEVTPQHLTLSAPKCYHDHGTFAQMNPPIRSQQDQEGLWEGITDKTVDVIGSDHAPHTVEEKNLGYPKSPSGISGAQTILYVMLKHVEDKKLSIHRLVELLSENPAKLFGLKKGFIKAGYQADLTVIDPHNSYTIKNDHIVSKSAISVFDQMKIPYKIDGVFIGGNRVEVDDAKIVKNRQLSMHRFSQPIQRICSL